MKNKSMFNHRSIIKVSVLTLMLMVFGQLQGTDIYHNSNITSNESWEYWDYVNNEEITHYVSTYISVSNGIVLTIDSRCTVVIQTYSSLTIYGEMLVECTFTGWSELYFNNVSGNSGLNNASISINVEVNNCDDPTIAVNFTNCNFNDSADLSIGTNSNTVIENCNFIDNNSSLYISSNSNVSYCSFAGGVRVGAASPTFTECDFDGNNGYGLRVAGSSSPIFENCDFINNNDYGVKMGPSASATFTNCLIQSNGSGGIYMPDDVQCTTSITLDDSEVLENTGNGIYGGNSETITLLNTDIIDNRGFGLMLPGANTSLSFSGLTIAESDTTAIKIHPNIVKNLPADSLMNFYDNHPDGIEISGGYITENATWQSDNYLYYFISDYIYINSGDTLQLPTNGYLHFRENAELEVKGTILADSVSFEPDRELDMRGTGYWQGIAFDPIEEYDQSILDGCTIKNAGSVYDSYFTAKASIIIDGDNNDGSVTIKNCYITEGGGNGIYMDRAQPTLINNEISFHDSCGIFLDTYCDPYIDSCNFVGNGTYGVFSNGTIYSTNNTGTLKNGSITDNEGPAARLPAEMIRDITTINISGNQREQRIEVAGGHIYTDAVWSGDYEYIVYGGIFAYDGRLTLEPGTVFKFESDKHIMCGSSLTAIGTPAEHIVFTSNQTTPAPGDWKYIYFDYPDYDSEFAYCDILYGGSTGGNNNAMIKQTYSDITSVSYDHCNIAYSATAGMYISGTNAYITNCDIHHNEGIGVMCYSSWETEAHISYSSFYNNGDYPIQAGSDFIKYITDNVNISDNSVDAIKVLGGGVNTGTWRNHNVPYDILYDITIADNEVLTIAKGNTIRFLSDNFFSVEGALRAVGNADSVITFTKFPDARTNWENFIFDSPDSLSKFTYCNFSFGGYNVNGMIEADNAGNLLEMSHCIIDSSVTAGLYLTNSSSPQIMNSAFINNAGYGIHIDSVGDNNPTFGSQLTEWNDLYGNGTYELYNDNSNEIIAEYVYWGTIDPIEIDAEIYDENDDGTLGLVNYSPYTNAEHDTLYYSSYGSISGTVILSDGVGNITDVEVSAGWMIVNPDINGDYIIDGLPPSTYDVKACLTNYADSTVMGVIVVGNQNTPDIDFTLYSAAPVADFSATPTYGNQPLEVQFTDLSINGPTSWLWDFGDGNTSVEQNPLHEFVDWGTFTVSLTATNDNGSDTEIKIDYITINGKPVADAGPDQTVNEQTLVQLDGSGSYDPEGETLAYLWTAPPEIQLSDSTNMQPTFTAPNVSDSTEFSIELIVYDGECYSDPSTVIITVLYIVGIDENPIKAAPKEFRLYPNYPNPFNPVTTISYDLPEDGLVELSVYNMRGEKVATLLKGSQEAGSYRLNWDGTSQSGEIVASGIYFLRIVSGSYCKTNKMIFIR